MLDAVGKRSFGECRRLLRPGGTYASTDLGTAGRTRHSPHHPADEAPCQGSHPEVPPAHVIYFKELLEAGALRPVIDRRYPLADVVEATRYVETGQKVGNVVLTVDG